MDHQYPKSFMKDSDGARDLTGGWFDCGDNALFGQTFFYSAYVLAKAYDLFPTGFPDQYHAFDYSDYKSANNWDFAGGSPDGIPDLLQELKYATDWIIKATPDASTFYSQLGDFNYDHMVWATSGFKSATLNVEQGGEKNGPRPIVKNPADGPMPAFAAAALALMSKHYRKYDPKYADTCLAHAKLAFKYSTANKTQTKGSAAYSAWTKRPLVQYAIGASELYRITGDAEFKTAWESSKSGLTNYGHGYTLGWNDADDFVWMNAIYLNDGLQSQFQSLFADKYKNAGTGEGGLSTIGDGWGFLRYPANQAFICAATQQLKSVSTYEDFIYNQVDFILGANTAKQSFVVGFCAGCTKSPQVPHHRNVFLYDGNKMGEIPAIPTRNKQFGYLVGFTKGSSGSFTESVSNYEQTEGGIDYNAGLVGALGYINSKLSPVDTSKFGPSTSILRSRVVGKLSLHRDASGFAFRAPAGQTLTQVTVLDASGREVWSSSEAASEVRWSGSAKSGLYVAQATAGGERFST
ncbi:MAG: endoglucanase-related protein glycoside hydrolase family 9 protein, partial [Fibrobacterota bacterium]